MIEKVKTALPVKFPAQEDPKLNKKIGRQSTASMITHNNMYNETVSYIDVAGDQIAQMISFWQMAVYGLETQSEFLAKKVNSLQAENDRLLQNQSAAESEVELLKRQRDEYKAMYEENCECLFYCNFP